VCRKKGDLRENSLKMTKKNLQLFQKTLYLAQLAFRKRMTTQDIVLSFFFILRKPIGGDGTIV